MILKLQKEVISSEYLLIPQGSGFALLVHPPQDIALDFSRQTGAQRDKPLMELPQKFKIHPWFIVIPFCKTSGYDLHQIMVTYVVLRK